MKVLLTGGAGFIGRPTARALHQAGAEVVVFDRAVDPADDILDFPRVLAAAYGCEAVVHLAAKVGLGVDLNDMDYYARSNDVGTAVVLRAAAVLGFGAWSTHPPWWFTVKAGTRVSGTDSSPRRRVLPPISTPATSTRAARDAAMN